MDLLFCLKDCLSRAAERKKTLIALSILIAIGFLLGLCFAASPPFYGYHYELCANYFDRVVFSERSAFLVLLERVAGAAAVLLLLLLAGMHPALLAAIPVALFYRAYTFGGCTVIFFSEFRVTGGFVAVFFYLPIHLLLDGVFLLSAALSCGRARGFRFVKEEVLGLCIDFLLLLLLILAVCLLEMLLLVALFHPIGKVA